MPILQTIYRVYCAFYGYIFTMIFGEKYVIIYVNNRLILVGKSLMNAQDLINLLQPHFPNAQIDAVNQGNKFDVRIIDDSFEGKRVVQRQQAVLALVNDKFATGEIHALNIQALTHAEWQAKQ